MIDLGKSAAEPLINRGYISRDIESPGDLDSYTFMADVGDHVEVRMADTSDSGDLYPCIELYGPSGGGALVNARGGLSVQSNTPSPKAVSSQFWPKTPARIRMALEPTIFTFLEIAHWMIRIMTACPMPLKFLFHV